VFRDEPLLCVVTLGALVVGSEPGRAPLLRVTGVEAGEVDCPGVLAPLARVDAGAATPARANGADAVVGGRALARRYTWIVRRITCVRTSTGWVDCASNVAGPPPEPSAIPVTTPTAVNAAAAAVVRPFEGIACTHCRDRRANARPAQGKAFARWWESSAGAQSSARDDWSPPS
jgi:hypothetical protein